MEDYPTSEELFEILLDTPYQDIEDIINTNPECRHICDNSDFWIAKGMKDFGIKTYNHQQYREINRSLGLESKEKTIHFGKAIAYLQTPGIPKTPNKITYN